MKATGIVRRVDELGRIVIPKEIRRTFRIEEMDPLEIYVEDDMIILKKYVPGCEICNNADGLIEVSGHHFCHDCAEKIIQAAKGGNA